MTRTKTKTPPGVHIIEKLTIPPVPVDIITTTLRAPRWWIRRMLELGTEHDISQNAAILVAGFLGLDGTRGKTRDVIRDLASYMGIGPIGRPRGDH